MLYDTRHKGQICMLNDASNVLTPALALLGFDLSTTSQDELDQATAKAIEQKSLVKAYDSVDYVARLLGGLPLVECYDGDAVWAIGQIGMSKVKYVLPREGFTVWCDAFAIFADAPNPYAAHLFINHVLDPKNMALCADATGYQPAVAAADPYVKSLVQRAMRPTDEVLSRGNLVKPLGEFQAAWDAAWKKIRSA
jgi:spermidine/putrescine-binding protein